MKERFAKFMAGRNGNDQFNIFLIGVSAAMLILSLFFKRNLRNIFSFLFLALIAYSYFRMFSKNIFKRRSENDRFIRLRYRIFAKLKGIKERYVQRKDYKFFTCPCCRATLRVPRRRGKIKIVCRKCGNTFIGKS